MPALVALVVAVLAVPALANPLAFRAERPVTPAEYAPVTHILSSPHVAANGEIYLALWTDRRGGPPTLYAARLRADGTAIDRVGVRIAPGAYAGSVIWTGRSFLMSYVLGLKIYVRTMAADGTLGEPIAVIERDYDAATDVRMATNGATVLIVEPGAKGALLDLDGHKLRDVQFGWTEDPYNGIDVAAAGSTYLAAAAAQNLVVQTVSASGQAGPVRPLASDVTAGVAIGSDGERFLALWSRNNLYAQVVGTDGAPIGTERQLTTLPAGTAQPWGVHDPDVEWRNGEFFATFVDWEGRAVHGMRLARDGTPVSQPARSAGRTTSEAHLATRGEGGVTVWLELAGGIHAGFFDAQSVAGTDPFREVVPVSVAAHPQYGVKLARSGAMTFAAWIEVTDTSREIRLAHTTGQRPVTVAAADRMVDLLVQDGVLWVIGGLEGELVVRRYDTQLRPIDAAPMYVTFNGNPNDYAAAAGDGAVAVASWHYDGTTSDVHLALIRPEGPDLLTTPVEVAHTPFIDHSVAVAWNGSEFVVAWAHQTAPPGNFPIEQPPDIVLAARVNTWGEVLDATPITVAVQGEIVRRVLAAPTANGVAVVWDGTRTYASLLDGTIHDLGGEGTKLGALAPHDGGLLLARGTTAFGPVPELATTTIEYLVLDASLGIEDSGALPPFESDSFWSSSGIDFDILGGLTAVVAYPQIVHGAEYGGVARVYVRSAGKDGRRRSVR